jgi:hypothetical protein
MHTASFGIPHSVGIARMSQCVSNEHTLDATVGKFGRCFRFYFDGAGFAPRVEVFGETGVLSTPVDVSRSRFVVDFYDGQTIQQGRRLVGVFK